MLKSLTPEERELVLLLFATEAEAEVNGEELSKLDYETARLIGLTGLLACEVAIQLPRDHPAVSRAADVLAWAGLMLSSPACWRFSHVLLENYRSLFENYRSPWLETLSSERREAVENFANYGSAHFGTAGDRLQNRDEVLNARRRLSITRDDGEADDWPLIQISYLVAGPVEGRTSALAYATHALEVTHGLQAGKLVLTEEGTFLYQLAIREDPSRDLTPNALGEAACFAVMGGSISTDTLESAAI